MTEKISTTETVKNVSSGKVKIAVEEYNDLMKRANEPKQVYNPVHTTIEKTPEMQATDLVHLGAFLLGGGGSLLIIGAVQFIIGRRKLASL